MNSLRRAFAQIASSQSKRKLAVVHPRALISQPYSTKQPSKPKENVITTAPSKESKGLWPKPSEIPYQVKVANSVNLIGHIEMPVRFDTSPDGKHWAATIITQEASSPHPSLRIPILFEGDLAHIAACHLKKNDHIHIVGQLTADAPQNNAIKGNADVQVMVQSVEFVALSAEQSKWKYFASQKQEEVKIDHSVSAKKDVKLDDSSPWCDVLDNPKQWWDYRSNKRSGLVNPRHPDFKRKDGALALWLDKKVPGSVMSALEGLEFDVQTPKTKYAKQTKGDASWKNLVENPNKWWDNRLDKKNVKFPDFKHKETGEALWLTDSPAWVLSKLPSLQGKKTVTIYKRDTLLS